MSVFRVEKTKGYTVMSNHHLRNHARFKLTRSKTRTASSTISLLCLQYCASSCFFSSDRKSTRLNSSHL